MFGANQHLGVALLDDASEAFERFTVVDVPEAVAALEEGRDLASGHRQLSDESRVRLLDGRSRVRTAREENRLIR
ncbi:hypothetical protein CVS53_00836 [Microbacterium oxydans]|nr:hypothetical protein CVS53_00836 [Microbacterium oxydans]